LDKIDLRGPLRADERLPQPTHRIVKVVEKGKEEKVKKSRPHHREGESGHKSHRHRSKNELKDSSDKTGDSKLIDLGTFDPISSPTNVTPIVQKDDTDFYAELSSPPLNRILEEPKKERRHHRREKEGKGKEGQERKSRDHHESRKKKEEKESPKEDKTRKPRSDIAVTEVPRPTPTPTRQTSKFKPLCQDDKLSVIYELKVTPKDGKKVLVALAFKNLSQMQISNVEFVVPGTLNTKIAQDSSAKATFVMQSGDTTNHNIIFDCQNIQQPQKLPGTITYLADETPCMKDFTLQFPCSAFILPLKLEKEEFFKLLKEGTFSSSSIEVKLEDEFSTFVISLAMLLHAELISQDIGASFYGKSVQGHQVAAYAKPKDASTVRIELKCTDETMGKSLLNEIGQFFPRA